MYTSFGILLSTTSKLISILFLLSESIYGPESLRTGDRFWSDSFGAALDISDKDTLETVPREEGCLSRILTIFWAIDYGF